MDSVNVGVFIAQLRKDKGLTQQDLADRLGVTNKAVSKWETGEGYPEITILPQLSDELGVTADEILRGERGRASQSANAGASWKMGPMNYKERVANMKFRNAIIIAVLALITAVTAFSALAFLKVI